MLSEKVKKTSKKVTIDIPLEYHDKLKDVAFENNIPINKISMLLIGNAIEHLNRFKFDNNDKYYRIIDLNDKNNDYDSIFDKSEIINIQDIGENKSSKDNKKETDVKNY